MAAPEPRILYVIGSMEVGGAERHLLGVATGLAQMGYGIHVFAFQPEGPLRPLFEKAGVQVHGPAGLPRWLNIRLTARLRAWAALMLSALTLWGLLWKLRPQVAHFFLPAAYLVGGLVSLFVPLKARVMSRRSMNFYQHKRRAYASVERWLHRRMDFITGNSRAVVAQLVEEGVQDRQLRLIYNGIDAGKFQGIGARAELRARLGIDADALVFIKVANLIPYKGHEDLVDALARVTSQLPQPWVALLVGRDDGIGKDIQARAQGLGLGQNIRLLGARADVPQLLACSDVGELCSHEEGFSNAVLEGMAAGLPMVVTDVGGNAEAVSDQETGFVVPPRNPVALGDALLAVALSPDREGFGRRGRAKVERQFSMPSCLGGYVSLYADCLKSRG